MRPIFLFDLDDTTVSSHHRQRFNADGSIDLPFWRAFNTAANIMRDSMLPLARVMIKGIAEGRDVGILTSRVMGKADIAWLEMHGMLPSAVYSRDLNDQRSTGDYKLARLHDLAVDRRLSWREVQRRVILWDDCKNVQSVLRNAGVRVIDPVQYNLTNKEMR